MFYENKIRVIDRTAIITPDAEISYAEMLANIRKYAQYVSMEKGAKTLVFAENCVEWIYSFFAIWQNWGNPPVSIVTIHRSRAMMDLS